MWWLNDFLLKAFEPLFFSGTVSAWVPTRKKIGSANRRHFFFLQNFFLRVAEGKEEKLFTAQDGQCCIRIVPAWRSLYISLKNRLYTQRSIEDGVILFRGWNGQAVWKSTESTVKTIRIRIKTASESVNR